MVVKLVLNGGIKSCCSVTPTEVVEKGVRSWIPATDELVVIDREKQEWNPDSLAALAQKYFEDSIFPLVYLDDKLTMVGGIPNRQDLLALMSGKIEYGITEKDILDAARENGLIPEDASTKVEQPTA